MVTPGRAQYLKIKGQYADSLLLFRMGDFYETFDSDAKVLAKDLDITLTAREMGKGGKIPLAGFPCHALDSYLGRLLKRGHKVAICDQTSDPAQRRGIVDRDVVRVVTPGTVIEPELLHPTANNYLLSAIGGLDIVGLAYIDISIGKCYATQISSQHFIAEIDRLAPAELLIPEHDAIQYLLDAAVPVSLQATAAFDFDRCTEFLCRHFEVATLSSFGFDNMNLAVAASGALIRYISETNRDVVSQIESIKTYVPSDYMILDPQSRQSLSLTSTSEEDNQSSLVHVIDATKTAAGSRLLKTWMGQPLIDKDSILKRQTIVESFYDNAYLTESIRNLLGQFPDIERIVNRIRSGKGYPRDLSGLLEALRRIGSIKDLLNQDSNKESWALAVLLDPLDELQGLLVNSINDEPSDNVGSGDVIKHGYSSELDNYREIAMDSQKLIADLERGEREKSGIKNLRISFNRILGYYIEVTQSNLSLVPEHYIRRQTLVSSERFYTDELKDFELQILSGKDKVAELENLIFRDICDQSLQYTSRLQHMAEAIAQADVFLGFATIAHLYQYIKPEITTGSKLFIKDGRHPVVERKLPPGRYISNDVDLDLSKTQLAILTGPNMAGKSTYLRQTALIVIMAQMGSYVPATQASIGIVDRIFTRIGLKDNLAAGESTFMVEMRETATILNQATEQSLIILDEIGRGTSTNDGLAIARAVAEYIHDYDGLGCKTLFATHYHELTDLPEYLTRARNFNMAVQRKGDTVIFLHNVEVGSSDQSYGINVAQLAGIPRSVIKRARDLLRIYAIQDGKTLDQTSIEGDADNELADLTMDLLGIEINSLSPIEALNKLNELQQRARNQ